MNNKDKKPEEKISSFELLLNRYFKLEIVIFSILIISLSFFLLLKPKYLEMKKLSISEFPTRTEKLQELTNYATELEKLVKNFTTFQTEQQTELKKLEKILPKKAELASLFAQLEALFKASGYELNSVAFSEATITRKTTVQPSQQQNDGQSLTDSWLNSQAATTEKLITAKNLPAEQVKTLNISLTIEGGGYFAFKALLENIENHLRIFDVTSISFTNIYPDEEKGEKAKYGLNLRTYYFP